MMRELAVVVFLVVAGTAPTEALLASLGDAQVQEAITYGRQTYERLKAEGRPIDDLDPEYVVDLGADVGRAMLFTEFSAVALETRRWLAIGEATPPDLERVRTPLRDRVRISLIMIGSRRDFLRLSKVVLVQGDRAIDPAGWDVHRTTARPGTPPTHLGSGQYLFALKDIDVTRAVTLLVRGDDGRETRFEFDLPRLR
jgi:hypothetical protein